MRAYAVYDLILACIASKNECKPRGQLIKEVEYFQGIITDPWSNYESRNYPLDYFKREMQWYLGADPFDGRICEHASMWKKIQQGDGRIFSNYGYFWFNPNAFNGITGFEWVCQSLIDDPDSRQAYIPMNGADHVFFGNKDFVCTKGIQFRIKNGLLNIHVDMRSSDVIYGIATDLPCFWTLWQMVSNTLGVPTGLFYFSTDSLHLYEKHFDMAKAIVGDGPYARTPVDAPMVDDTTDLISQKAGTYESDFGKWLGEVEL